MSLPDLGIVYIGLPDFKIPDFSGLPDLAKKIPDFGLVYIENTGYRKRSFNFPVFDLIDSLAHRISDSS